MTTEQMHDLHSKLHHSLHELNKIDDFLHNQLRETNAQMEIVHDLVRSNDTLLKQLEEALEKVGSPVVHLPEIDEPQVHGPNLVNRGAF